MVAVTTHQRRGGGATGRSRSAPAPAAAPARTRPPCANPDALGIGRTVEIDTTGGPGFGFEHFKDLDFLRDKEVVLTFDDGPWPVNTPAVLKTLAEECTTGIFFPIGKHATYYPEILKQVMAAGHSIGSHTWSHAALVNKKLTEQQRAERGHVWNSLDPEGTPVWSDHDDLTARCNSADFRGGPCRHPIAGRRTAQ